MQAEIETILDRAGHVNSSNRPTQGQHFGFLGPMGRRRPPLHFNQTHTTFTHLFSLSQQLFESHVLFGVEVLPCLKIAISNTLPCSVRSRASRPLYCVIFDAYALFESRPIPNRTRIGPLPTFVSKFLRCLIFEQNTRLVLVFPVNHYCFWFFASIFI